jgi:hypothetical protein
MLEAEAAIASEMPIESDSVARCSGGGRRAQPAVLEAVAPVGRRRPVRLDRRRRARRNGREGENERVKYREAVRRRQSPRRRLRMSSIDPTGEPLRPEQKSPPKK